MKIAMVLLALAATLAGIAPSQAFAGAPPAADGLVAVASRQLDEVATRPGVDFAAYRRVIVEPAHAALRKDWLKDLNTTRGPARWLTQDDAQQIVDEAATRLAAMLARVFGERGYEIVTAPAPGVLRLAPTVTDLDVYAPDAPAPGIARYYARDAGQATLALDVRDAVTGELVARVIDRGTAEQIRLHNRVTPATNAFWFDALFREWASACATELAGPVRADHAAAAR